MKREIHAILLASGESERMPGRDKLLLNWHGQPLIVHMVQQLLQAPVSHLTVVIRSNTFTRSVLASHPNMTIIDNPNPSLGLGLSLHLGLKQVGSDVGGLMICLADMPLLSTAIYSDLIDSFSDLDTAHPNILIPTFKGIRGHPILFSNELLPKLLALPSDRDAGAKDLLQRSNEWITELSVKTNAVLLDIDHWDDYITLHS